MGLPTWQVAPRFISYTRKLEYLEIAKCACSSVKVALLACDYLTPKDVWDVHTSKHWHCYDETYRPRLRFTFVRHPVTRILAAYRDKVWAGYTERSGLPRTASLADFLRWISANKRQPADKHWAPQTELFRRRNIKPGDFIGRLETIQLDWAQLSAKFKLPPLPHRNRTHGEVEVTQECLDLIQEMYAQDFKQLHYTPAQWENFNAYLLPAADIQPLP